MPFYIRKSISAGPFRFNLSKSGIGLSVGVKGLRVGTGPRGHYIHAGRGGLYYRSSLGRAGQPTARPELRHAEPARPFSPAAPLATPAVEMIEVESGDVLEMREERFAELLDEINAKQSQLPLSTVLGFGSALAGFLVLAVAGPGGLLALAMALPAWALGRWLDSYKRRTVLFYDLDADAAAAYEAVTGAFDEILNCRGKWHVEAGGTVRDLNTWKRNAGASHLVNKKPTTFSYAAPAVIATNITPPSVQVGRQTVYFLPDAVLVVDRANVGAVGYDDLQLQWQDSAFIEEGTVPSDAEVIGHAWKHPNKNGGPDRRFSNNYQIPICRYEVLHLSSPTGLNEMLELSRTGVSEPFARALKELTHRTGASRQALSSPLAKIT